MRVMRRTTYSPIAHPDREKVYEVRLRVEGWYWHQPNSEGDLHSPRLFPTWQECDEDARRLGLLRPSEVEVKAPVAKCRL